MYLEKSKQRIYALFLVLGAAILLSRTIIMLSNGYAEVFITWVAVLLLIEFLLDLSWLISAIRWWISNTTNKALLPLRLAAVAILVHAVRVVIYVFARVGPWKDFDIKPEYRILKYTRWSWDEIYFASTMSLLGVVGVIVLWRLGKHNKGGFWKNI